MSGSERVVKAARSNGVLFWFHCCAAVVPTNIGLVYICGSLLRCGIQCTVLYHDVQFFIIYYTLKG